MPGGYQPDAPRLRLRVCNAPALKMSNKLRAVPSAAMRIRQPQRRHLPVVGFSVETLLDPQPGQVGCSRKSCFWVIVAVAFGVRLQPQRNERNDGTNFRYKLRFHREVSVMPKLRSVVPFIPCH